MRDDFSLKTKRALEKNAGHVCSYPECRLLTRFIPYGSLDRKKINIGQAAHIAAAAPGGPRYDKTMTPKARSDISNGIWLCSNHGKYIDVAASMITVKQHEEDVRTGRINAATIRYVDHCCRIRELVVSGVGSFVSRQTVLLGRLNFLYGPNGVGKSALVQLACWFSGKGAVQIVCKRFLNRHRNMSTKVELGVSFGGGNECLNVQYVWNLIGKHLRLDATGSNVADALKVRGRLNALIVYTDYDYVKDTGVTAGFRPAISGMSNLLGISRDEFLATICAEGSRLTPIGFKIRRKGAQNDIEVCRQDDGFWQEYGNLSESERLLTILDMAYRCVSTAPIEQTWLFVVESQFVERLFADKGGQLVDVLLNLPPNIQMLVCVLNEKTLNGLLAGRESEFVREQVDKLIVYRRRDMVVTDSCSSAG